MPEELGPHLLGRKKDEPDDRDWSLTKLRSFREAPAVTPQTTLQEVHDLAGQNWSWRWIASTFWKILKSLFGSHPEPPPPPPPPSGGKLWTTNSPLLDQGNFGTCVGNGWAHWGNFEPVQDIYREEDARAIYYDATCFDGDCDSTYQNGASVRSGAKAMQKRGRLSAYARPETFEALKTWVQSDGTATIGADWHRDMFSPDDKGFVTPTGVIDGGHCFLAIGYVPAIDVWAFANSWGTQWGDNGCFYMRGPDFEKLLSQGGDAWCALELPQ